jgi:uncharacterized membrane protein
MTKISKDKQHVLLLSAVYLIITLVLAQFHFIWKDEAYTLITTSEDLPTAFRRALKLESQAPLYFVLLNLWRTLSGEIFFARLFSITCILTTIIYFYYFAKKNYPIIGPLVATVLFMVNPFIIWAALEIRLYSLAIFITLIILDIFIEYFIRGKQTRLNYWLFTLVSTLAVLVHYYMAFLLFSLGIYLLITKKWKYVLIFFSQMIIPVLSLVMIMSLIISQFDFHTGNIENSFSLKEILYFVYKRVESYILPLEDLTANSILRWSLRTVFLILIFLLFFKKNKAIKEKKQLFLFIVLVLNLCIYGLLYLIVSEYFVEMRHTAPLFVLLMAIIFQVANNHYNKRVFYSLAVYLGIIYTGATYNLNKTPKGYEYTCIKNFIIENNGTNVPVFIYRNQIHLPLQFTCSQKSELIPLPVSVDYDGYYTLSQWAIKDSSQYARAFNKYNSDTFLLITDNVKYVYGVDYYPEILEKYIEDNFYTIDSITCTGTDEFQGRRIVKK